jgi:hypothetical protein
VTRQEITEILKRNLNKSVRIVYASGDVKRVVPISIDHLGFVYEAEVGESTESFFLPFENIESVLVEGAWPGSTPETEADTVMSQAKTSDEIVRQLQGMLETATELRGERHHLEEWRGSVQGAFLESRIETISEILDWIAEE